MTTIRVADIVPERFLFRVSSLQSVNIETTGISTDYQLLIFLAARSELFLRINGEIYSDLGAGVYIIAIRNGAIRVYFVGNLPSDTAEGESECRNKFGCIDGGNIIDFIKCLFCT